MTTGPLADQAARGKQLVTDFYQRVIVPGDADAVEEFVAPGITQHGADIPADGIAAMKEFVRRTRTAAGPPPGIDPEFVIAEGDLVTICRYTPRPEKNDPAASYDFFSFETYRVRDGKIVERWSNANKATLANG